MESEQRGKITFAIILFPSFLRSTDVERCAPKFLKNWETQLFQKSLGIRCSIGYQGCSAGVAENVSFSALFRLVARSTSFCGHRFPLPHTNMQSFDCKLV